MNQVYKFPEGFLWGTATAAHQVEGNNINSDWWAWEQNGGSEEPSGIAYDHYTRFAEDFRLTKEVLHNNAHRLSIEWARIEPEEGVFDNKEIEHYRAVLRELKKLRLTSFVTLFHFTLPGWFAKKGGFEKKENIKYFIRYVKLCAEELSNLVDFWITVNEPNVYIGSSYLLGVWPPEKKSPISAVKTFLNLAETHRKAYLAIHEKIPIAKAGMVMNTAFYEPANKRNPIYGLAKNISEYFGTYCFYDLTRGYHDFLGINYYFHYTIS